MLLYATTTSERASKGQGGNEYVAINLKDEEQMTILEIRALPAGKYTHLRVWIRGQGESKYYKVFSNDFHVEEQTQKGKKQKTAEYVHCKLCGDDFLESRGHNCKAI